MDMKEYEEACMEINEILEFLDEEEVNKIPYELRELFKKVELKNYNPHIDSSKSLDRQELKKETKDILAYLYLNYWCDETEKKEVNKILYKNFEKKQLELSKKYNPKDIFKNRK